VHKETQWIVKALASTVFEHFYFH